MKAHVEPSCQSLFGLWLSPRVYTWSYSKNSAERSQAFLKTLILVRVNVSVSLELSETNGFVHHLGEATFIFREIRRKF